MKEEGINKLIKLLDEYDNVQYHKINHKIENGEIYRNVGGTDGWHQVWRYCKQFGFIQRLVKNDKIDFDKVYNGFITFHFHKGAGYRPDLVLLMILSIQDNPIEFLISILK